MTNTPQKANDMSTTEFRITGPGWYMTRDGRRVFVSGSDMHNSEYYPWRYGATLIAEHGGYWYYRSQPEPEDIVSRCPDAPPAPAPEPKEEAETLFVCDFCGATKPHAAKLPDGWLSRYSTSDGVRRTACDKHDCWVKEDEDYKARLPQATTRLERAKAALEEARRRHKYAVEERDRYEKPIFEALLAVEAAEVELGAVESEARTAKLPPRLVEVARAVHADYQKFPESSFNHKAVMQHLAQSHGVSVEDLRRAVEGGK